MSRKGFAAIGIVLIVIIILVVAGAAWYYLTKNSPQNLTYNTPAQSQQGSTTSQIAETTTIPSQNLAMAIAGIVATNTYTPQAVLYFPYQIPFSIISNSSTTFMSSDQQWKAYWNDSAATTTGITNGVMNDPNSKLEIARTDGSVMKVFTPEQFGVSSTCSCAVYILGWAGENLWLYGDYFVEESTEGNNGFFKIQTSNWTISHYQPSIETLFKVWDIGTFNNGTLITSNWPYSPVTAPEDFGFTTTSTDPFNFSLYLYDIQTDKSKTLVSETTTEGMVVQALRHSSNFHGAGWVNDSVFQYYDFSAQAVATTSVDVTSF